MKNPHKIIILILFILGFSFSNANAQDEAPKSKPIISIKYFVSTSHLPFLEVNTQTKTGRILEALKNIPVSVYFGEEALENLIGKTTTGIFGKSKVYLTPEFKTKWDSLNDFTFTAVADSLGISSEVAIKKAALFLDTLNEDGLRSVKAILKEKKGNDWIAVGATEMKLRIKRLTGNLSVGDDETYTSDSSGFALAEFKKDGIPGNEKGNIVLVAKVEDNETYGNLEVEQQANWGKPTSLENHFWHRSLWSTGNRAPIWLLTLAFGIIIGIWGTIIYLVFQMIKIKKIGV